METLYKLKELYDYDTRNEYFLLPLMAEILNKSNENCNFLTEGGFCVLFNTLNEDLELIKSSTDTTKQLEQEALCRLCLYFTTVYNVTILYSGLCYTLRTDEGMVNNGRFFTDELITYFFEIDGRSELINKVSEFKLRELLPLLTDEYATIFNVEKKKCWTKNIFETDEEANKPIHIPIHGDDVPKDFDIKSAICMN